MAANIIFKGTDTPVIFSFEFNEPFKTAGLNNFTNIVFMLGGESYNLASGKIVIDSPTQLSVMIGDVTTLAPGGYWPVITGYNLTYSDGIVIAHKNLGLPERVIIDTVN